MQNKDGFWIVWSPTGRNPQHRHKQESIAMDEAKRLALACPYSEFYVLFVVYSAVYQPLSETRYVEPLPF